jgi:hypothetical protein
MGGLVYETEGSPEARSSQMTVGAWHKRIHGVNVGASVSSADASVRRRHPPRSLAVEGLLLRVTPGLLLAFVIACGSDLPSDPTDLEATPTLSTVTRVIDGDTVVVEGIGTVRLIGVDTPETAERWATCICSVRTCC